MHLLLSYLQEHFPDGIDEQLALHFRQKFGVNVRQEDALCLFKYGQLDARWEHPLTHQCRGSIARYDGQQWSIVSLPFDKFFNRDEGHSALHTRNAFEAHIDRLSFSEKADGTGLQLWFDPERKRWRISTLGTITTEPERHSRKTFEELFFETLFPKHSEEHLLGKEHPDMSLFQPGHTYIFELCTRVSKLITEYDEDHCKLLGIRRLDDAQFIAPAQTHFADIIAHFPGIQAPKQRHFRELGIKTLEQAEDYVEKEAFSEEYGQYPEGFVVLLDGVPVAKMKNTRYLQLQHANNGDLNHTKKVVTRALYMGNIDDLYPRLNEELQAFADAKREPIRQALQDAHDLLDTFATLPHIEPKEFAQHFQAKVQKRFGSFFFERRAEILSGTPQLHEALEQWIKRNPNRFSN